MQGMHTGKVDETSPRSGTNSTESEDDGVTKVYFFISGLSFPAFSSMLIYVLRSFVDTWDRCSRPF